jgi:Domain of unknown function (DUF1918)
MDLLGPRVKLGTQRKEKLMSKQRRSAGAKPGDVLVIVRHRVGEAERTGEILEVLGEPSHEHYRVSWDDGHESVFYPSSDASVRPSSRRRKEER